MGYAKLNFATSVTTAQAMYDVVRILNGTITSTASLSYASTVNSEIVNTLGENWTVLYGSVADTTTAYVVTSPCLSSAKTHYVKLHMFNGSASGWDLSTAFSTAGAGIGCNSISGATSATAVSNPAFYSTSSGATGGGRFIVRVDASNANIYIHWSQHHIAFYGICGSGTGFHGSYEYPETGLTQFSNYPPVLQYQYQYAAGSTFRTATVPATGTGNGITFQAIQFYLPTTASLEGVYNLGVSGFGTVIPSDFNPVTTLAADGSSVYPLVPFYWSLPSLGVPFVNISQLCGVYRMARSATTAEDLFTIGANSYVWLPIGTATSGGTQESAIALLKA